MMEVEGLIKQTFLVMPESFTLQEFIDKHKLLIKDLKILNSDAGVWMPSDISFFNFCKKHCTSYR